MNFEMNQSLADFKNSLRTQCPITNIDSNTNFKKNMAVPIL